MEQGYIKDMKKPDQPSKLDHQMVMVEDLYGSYVMVCGVCSWHGKMKVASLSNCKQAHGLHQFLDSAEGQLRLHDAIAEYNRHVRGEPNSQPPSSLYPKEI